MSAKRKEIMNHEKILKRLQIEIAGLKSKISDLKKEEKDIRRKSEQLNTPKAGVNILLKIDVLTRHS